MATDIAQNKTALLTYYTAAQHQDMAGIKAFFHADFEMHSPDYLPFGGVHKGAEHFITDILPLLGSIMDFSRCEIIHITAEEDRVVSVIQLGVTGTDKTIVLSEHWTIDEDQARTLWVSYYEPKALMDHLARIEALVTP